MWVVFPTVGKVYDYTGPSSVQVLNRTQTLDGGKLLPGFLLPLTEIFEEQPGREEPPGNNKEAESRGPGLSGGQSARRFTLISFQKMGHRG